MSQSVLICSPDLGLPSFSAVQQLSLLLAPHSKTSLERAVHEKPAVSRSTSYDFRSDFIIQIWATQAPQAQHVVVFNTIIHVHFMKKTSSSLPRLWDSMGMSCVACSGRRMWCHITLHASKRCTRQLFLKKGNITMRPGPEPLAFSILPHSPHLAPSQIAFAPHLPHGKNFRVAPLALLAPLAPTRQTCPTCAPSALVATFAVNAHSALPTLP